MANKRTTKITAEHPPTLPSAKKLSPIVREAVARIEQVGHELRQRFVIIPGCTFGLLLFDL